MDILVMMGILIAIAAGVYRTVRPKDTTSSYNPHPTPPTPPKPPVSNAQPATPKASTGYTASVTFSSGFGSSTLCEQYQTQDPTLSGSAAVDADRALCVRIMDKIQNELNNEPQKNTKRYPVPRNLIHLRIPKAVALRDMIDHKGFPDLSFLNDSEYLHIVLLMNIAGKPCAPSHKYGFNGQMQSLFPDCERAVQVLLSLRLITNDPLSFNAATVKEIRSYLSEQGIKAPSKLKRAELLRFMGENIDPAELIKFGEKNSTFALTDFGYTMIRSLYNDSGEICILTGEGLKLPLTYEEHIESSLEDLAQTKENTKNKNIEGVIGYLHLEDFWFSCSERERNLLSHFSQDNPIEGDVTTSESPVSYLARHAHFALSVNEFAFAEKLIEGCEKHTKRVVDLHFLYNEIIRDYYKLRDSIPEAIDLVIKYCKKDIDLFPRYIGPLRRGLKVVPQCPSFQQLSTIYERQKQYTEAIVITQLAIEYGLSDGTKGDFEKRLERLEAKLNKIA